MKLLAYLPVTSMISLSTQKPTFLLINYNNLFKRSITCYRNKIYSQSLPCTYCKGTGYIPCNHCSSGCWRCEDSTMEKCPYCNGDGKGRFQFGHQLMPLFEPKGQEILNI